MPPRGLCYTSPMTNDKTPETAWEEMTVELLDLIDTILGLTAERCAVMSDDAELIRGALAHAVATHLVASLNRDTLLDAIANCTGGGVVH